MTQRTFSYTGAVQTFVVPDNIAGPITFGVVGGAGAPGFGGGAGSPGGEVNGTKTVAPGATLYITVGGKANGKHGGWPAGGDGGDSATANLNGGGGGGASDVRLGSNIRAARFVVAAGAGGDGAAAFGLGGLAGGDGGASTGNGGNGSAGGHGGTQSAGGAGGTAAGDATSDGNAGTSSGGGSGASVSHVNYGGGGGGGDGYFGGGGGGGGSGHTTSDGPGGGAGGSNYVGGLDTVNWNLRGTDSESNGLVTLTYDLAPNTPVLTGPHDGASLNIDVAQTFGWTFSDDDPDDTQSSYDLRYSDDGGVTWTTVSKNTPNTSRTFSAGTFDPGSYQWQVRVYDAQGYASAWSPSSFFTAAEVPDGPTITYPTSGGTVGQYDHVDWSYPTQQAYRVRRLADDAGDPDTSTIYFDSGDVTDTATRTLSLEFDIDSRWEHIQVRIKSSGLWSAYSDDRVFVSYNPPATPTVQFGAADPDDDGHITALEIIWQANTDEDDGPDGPPDAIWVDVYLSTDGGDTSTRIATQADPNGSLVFATPASDVEYSVQVVAFANQSSSSTSGWVS